MEKWLVSVKGADFNGWAREFQISPILAWIIRNRGVKGQDEVRKYLYGSLEDCYSPWLLKDMDRAVEVILRFVDQGAKIRVIGDYDVDGICSSYILTEGLRFLGARVDTAIPHRIHDGYGLNEGLIEEARRDGVELIVTCDNGIAAAPQISQALEAGIEVVVTDHHEVPFLLENGEKREMLPPAAAVVDPKQASCPYPFKGICGGVVAYKLVQALLEDCSKEDAPRPIDAAKEKELLDEFLQFAALATVCDVMELKDENRILVKEGLKRLSHSRNLGIRALIEVNGIEASKLSAYHLGFVLGPCLNATGRLDTALRSLELLGSTTKAQAMQAASKLKELNDSRKNLTKEGVDQAEAYLEEHGFQEDPVLVVYLPQVHESLAGIIAGRVREKHNHPVFVLTQGEEGVKGSGRSIDAYHMYEHMVRVQECFSKFGGHKLAAGLSLAKRHESPEQDVEAFREALNETADLTRDDFIPRVHIDVPMPLSYADLDLAIQLEKLEPFGVGNPKPLFADKQVRFLRGQIMGAKRNCGKYQVASSDGVRAELVYFGDIERFHAFLDEKYGAGSATKLYEKDCDYEVSITYQVGRNVYRGQESLQLVMQNYC